MKFYKRFPGDITIKTGDLSLTEFGAYDRLLDWYYANERPIPGAEVYSITGARTRAEREAVDRVLGRCFDYTPDWDFCSAEIEADIARQMTSGRQRAAWFAGLPRATRTAMEARRRAAKWRATPGWLSNEQRAAIDAKYVEAQEATERTGEEHEVDHVVPLVSETVCGMHVPWNLRVITATENAAKGNSYRDGDAL